MTKEEIIQQYPYLIPMTEDEIKRYKNRTCGASNLRRELKKHFPDTKFSVTSQSYSGGDSIHVNWINGPTSREVREVTDKYQEGFFDGMTDSYTYEHKVFNEVFGGVKFVLCQRSFRE